MIHIHAPRETALRHRFTAGTPDPLAFTDEVEETDETEEELRRQMGQRTRRTRVVKRGYCTNCCSRFCGGCHD